MSFISKENGLTFEPGWFLANNEDCTRETRQMAQDGAEDAPGGGKYVKGGTVWPSNDANAIGIVFEDVDVTSGDMPGSVVTSGHVYEDRLPNTLAAAAKTALTGKGFTFTTAPKVERPY